MIKIKELFKKFKERYRYSMCYTLNESTGKAVFNMCECDNCDCPFNVNRKG